MILDSNFLVHLERERRRQKTGPASAFLLSHSGEPLFVTPTIAGEIAAGESMADVGLWKAFIGVFQLLEIVDEVTWRYGQVYRHLRAKGEMIGQNDLWIAATALTYGRSIVTRNTGEFSRVPGLNVLSF